MLPAFVEKDPYGAGVAAVLANVNDLAAMGARPLALVDTVTGPRGVVKEILEGLKWAGRRTGCRSSAGTSPRRTARPACRRSDSAAAERVLSATHAAPGQALVLACCLDGRMREDFLFYPSFEERGERLAGDVRVLADVASGAPRWPPRMSAWPG